MTDKEQIMIDGVDVSGCKHYKINGKCRIPHYQQGIKYVNCNCNEWDCYFKQFQKEKFENLNNRQMVECAENLIYENSELIKNLKEKEQECEQKDKQIKEWNEYTNLVRSWITQPAKDLGLDTEHSFGVEHFTFAVRCLKEEHEKLKQECEELKNTLKKLSSGVVLPAMPEPEVINLADRYRKALVEIEGLISDYEFIRCPINDDVNCNYFTRNKILDIINKVKNCE